jgi:hypothetical protein
MQAITTKYIGPTNVRSSKVKATAQAGSLTLHWDDGLNADDNHKRAARALADKLSWYGRWVSGWTSGANQMCVWVCIAGEPYTHEFTLYATKQEDWEAEFGEAARGVA